MIEIEKINELERYVGYDFAPSAWLTVTQEMIDRFADATGDRNWYHCDVERCAREMPGGKTIAHGLMTLSLVPGMTDDIMRVTKHGRALNYGCDRVRYPAPVPVDSRLRLHMRATEASRQKGGTMIRRSFTMELDGSARPALVTDTLTLSY